MNTITKQFNKNFFNLPEEVRFYYNSDLSGDLIMALIDKHKLDEDAVYGLVFDIVDNNFDFSLIDNQAASWGLMGKDKQNFAVDLIGQIFLPIDNFLTDKDISQEISKRGGQLEKYSVYKENFYDLIQNENFKVIDRIIDAYERVDKEAEAEAVKDLFNNSLIDILDNQNSASTRELGGFVIFLLEKLENFQNDLVRIMLSNKQKIGDKNISIDGKALEPTVANWLKSFIKFNGTNFFDNIALATYLSQEENAKKLNKINKDRLSSVLKLYRNIAFFPDNMKDLSPDKWEIFPATQDGGVDKVKSKNKQAITVPKTTHDIEDREEVVVSSENKEPINKSDSLLAELETSLQNYSPNSLEYKAIKQEISRLKSSNLRQKKGQ